MSAVPQPRILSGSDRRAREDRAQMLAGHFTKFIGEHVELLVQVREDFLVKPKSETIMGCKNFTEYCISVLHYSEAHIRKLIAGRNPASEKYNGTTNRKPQALTVVPPPSATAPTTAQSVIPPAEMTRLEQNNPVLAAKIQKGTVTVRDTRPVEENEININGDYFRHLGHLLDGVFKGQIKEKLDVLCTLPLSKVTPKIKQDAKEIASILEDVSRNVDKYLSKLKKISNAKVA